MITELTNETFVGRPTEHLTINVQALSDKLLQEFNICRSKEEVDFVSEVFKSIIDGVSDRIKDELAEINEIQIKEGMFRCGS